MLHGFGPIRFFYIFRPSLPALLWVIHSICVKLVYVCPCSYHEHSNSTCPSSQLGALDKIAQDLSDVCGFNNNEAKLRLYLWLGDKHQTNPFPANPLPTSLRGRVNKKLRLKFADFERASAEDITAALASLLILKKKPRKAQQTPHTPEAFRNRYKVMSLYQDVPFDDLTEWGVWLASVYRIKVDPSSCTLRKAASMTLSQYRAYKAAVTLYNTHSAELKLTAWGPEPE